MSKKSAKIAELIEENLGQELPAHYLGYFACFNRQMFYEAHDVLEELWLAEGREGANYGFYKGLIQFAGAFVHLQKHTDQRPRLRPSAALFKLSQSNLRTYPARHRRLDVAEVHRLIEEWLERLEAGRFELNPLTNHAAPKLVISDD